MNSTDATALFTVENPTSYQGLMLQAIDASYILQSGNKTLMPTRPINVPSVQLQPLDPNQRVRIPITFTTSNYTDKNLFKFNFAISPSTLMDKQGWIQVNYWCDAAGSTNCDLTKIAFQSGPDVGPSPTPKCKEAFCDSPIPQNLPNKEGMRK
jgi:hypothetical protein